MATGNSGLGAFWLLVLSGCGTEHQETPARVPFFPWEEHTELRELRVLRAVDGVMDTPLDVENLTWRLENVEIDGCPTITTRSYNGQVPGPTIRVRPGDIIAPLVTNNLPPETQVKPDDWPANIPHNLNYTNLHTHGLHVSPGQNPNGTQSDNVSIAIVPGQSVQYEIQVPENHPSGTFWYHPHRHGAVAAGVASGLGGLIIIEDAPGEMPAWISTARERSMVIQALEVQAPPGCGNVTIDYENPPTSGLHFNEMFVAVNPQGPFNVLNGAYQPVIKMKPGEVQRWRMLNASADSFYPLSFDPVVPTAVAAPALRIIARDGLTLEYPEVPERPLGTGYAGAVVPETAYDRRWRILPGQRLDVMVQAPDAPAVFKLQSTGDDSNAGPPATVTRPVLAYLVVEGEPTYMDFPPAPSASSPAEPLPAAWGRPGSLYPQTLAELPTARNPQIGYWVCRLNYTVNAECEGAWARYIPPADSPAIPPLDPMFLVSGPDPEESGGETAGTDAYDKALLFDGSRVDHCMALNTVEEWLICNESAATHPFHIHTNSFEVLEISGVELGPTDPTDPGAANIKWLDTVGVPGKRLRKPDESGPWPCEDWDPNDPEDTAEGPPSRLPGYVVFRTKPIDFTGFIVQHCHILRHEDTGMMQRIEIYDPGGPSTTIPGTDTLSRCTNDIQ